MQLFQIYKTFFNFISLLFFVFFVSCGVSAQDIVETQDTSLKNNSTQDSQITIETQTSTTAKPNKNKVSRVKSNKVKKKLKKTNKVKKIKNKKNTRKIVRKKIIKKIYVVKKKKEEVVKPEIKAEEKVEDLTKAEEITDNYLIEIEPKDDCDKMVETQCLRGDSFFQEPYFHYTLLTIFNYKIVAEQFLENNKRDKNFLKVKDGEYIVRTKKGNKILIAVKNGIVDKLLLLEGDLNLEIKITSKCQYSDKLFAFHNLYETNEINSHNFFYSDKNNFRGLVEADVFNEKYQPKVFYSIFNLPNKEKRPTQDINLCKIGGDIQAIEREFTKTECNRKFKCTMKTLEGYGSEGFIVKDRNFSFFDFYENNKIITLNPEQIRGLLDEVAKLSGEDKKLLKSRCFNDKNVDLVSCSASEKCEDYLIVQACEVNYFYDKNRLENK